MEKTAESLFGRPEQLTLEPFRFEPRPKAVGDSTQQTPGELQQSNDSPVVADAASDITAEQASSDLRASASEYSRIGHTRWCSCENCKPMSREVDCFCCQECPAAKSFASQKPGTRCVTEHEDFSAVCLHPSVLRVAMTAYSEFCRRTDPFSKR